MSGRDRKPVDELADELRNFKEIAANIKPSPGEIPQVEGIDVAGLSLPLAEVVGGDHLIYIDFNRRYDLDRRILRAQDKGRTKVKEKLEELRSRAGILVADVSGHRATDALIAAMLHQAFLVGAYYELDRNGEITTRLFEHLNTRFFKTTSVSKYFTMIYGEINSGGSFRFISAGHPPPAIFSREFGSLFKISPDRIVTFPPVGMLPPGEDPDELLRPGMRGKKRYEVNEISLLSPGDILLLFSDGFAEHGDGSFFPDRVESLLAECSDLSSQEICERLETAIRDSSPPDDDISVVVIRRTV
jgi:serine phosphatase RsbU (regulator of sigma subunit)